MKKIPRFTLKKLKREDAQSAVARMLYEILRYRIKVKKQYNWKPEDEACAKNVIDRSLWTWSVGVTSDGKYEGNPVWSEGALRSFKKWGKAISSGNMSDSLRHEHVVPRAKLINYLFEKYEQKISYEDLFLDLKSKGIGAVVTKEEHSRLDDKNVDFNNVWKRYKDAGIKIVNHNFLDEETKQQLRDCGILGIEIYADVQA
jgi:hypothetical protein